jgi:glutamate racemase
MKIGVFDSGVGGLMVLRALLRRVPADYVYLGDTARLPYGAKSRETVGRYAVSSAKFLVEEQGAEFLVIACNTASALALDAIRDAVAVPVLGVVETGANAADASSRTRDVLVIATAATVASHAYAAACGERKLRAIEKACPLLVPLVEEGWIEHPVTAEVLRIYMAELMEQAREAGLNADTLVLGVYALSAAAGADREGGAGEAEGDRFGGGDGGSGGGAARHGRGRSRGERAVLCHGFGREVSSAGEPVPGT